MVPGTWYLVPGTWYLVHGTWYLVPSTGTQYLVTILWYIHYGIWYMVYDTWNTCSMIHGTCSMIHAIQYLKKDTSYCDYTHTHEHTHECTHWAGGVSLRYSASPISGSLTHQLLTAGTRVISHYTSLAYIHTYILGTYLCERKSENKYRPMILHHFF